MTHPGGHHGNAIFVFLAFHKLFFRSVTPDHKRGAAFRVNEIHADAPQFGNSLVINLHGAQIFVLACS
jgi:hypothetical protein